MTDQPNGAAPVVEAAPPSQAKCPHCKGARPSTISADLVKPWGRIPGPFCGTCYARAQAGELRTIEEIPRGTRFKMTSGKTAEVLMRVLQWNDHLEGNLELHDFIDTATALKDRIVSEERQPGVTHAALAHRIGMPDPMLDGIKKNWPRDKSIGRSCSCALKGVLMEELMRAMGKNPESLLNREDMWMEEPGKVEKVSDTPEIDAMVKRWTELSDQMLDVNAWPREDDDARAHELTMLAGKICNRLTAIEKGPKGNAFVTRTDELVADREDLRGQTADA